MTGVQTCALPIWIGLAQPNPVAIPPSSVATQSNPAMVASSSLPNPTNPATTPSGPSTQSSGATPGSHALAEAILQQGVMLNTASSVTDSSSKQHERRVPPQRRKTKRNMSLDVPAILAVLAVLALGVWLWSVLLGRKRNTVQRLDGGNGRSGHKDAEQCHAFHAVGTPTVRAPSGAAGEIGIRSEGSTEDRSATLIRQ